MIGAVECPVTLQTGMHETFRVTTYPDYFEEHAESLELWSPGNSLFIAPEIIDGPGVGPASRDAEGYS